MPFEIKLNHVAIVVPDLERALKFWQDGLGLVLERVVDVPEQAVKVAFFPAGDSEIELVQPTNEESGLTRYLDKRGPGLHHICLEVEDIRSYLKRFRDLGVRLINEEPLSTSDGKLYAFIHPASAQGVLVELYQLPA